MQISLKKPGLSLDSPSDSSAFFYSGILKAGRKTAMNAFISAINELIKEKSLDINKIRLIYAGGEGREILNMVVQNGIEKILEFELKSETRKRFEQSVSTIKAAMTKLD